jgi:hypothetical protein
VAGFDLAQKGRARDAIIMRWTMTMTTMARGGSKGKSINDSISEHKCIVISNINYSITIIYWSVSKIIFMFAKISFFAKTKEFLLDFIANLLNSTKMNVKFTKNSESL